MTPATQFEIWEDVLTAGIGLREERDACSWALGDLALATCTAPPQGGRPKAGAAEWTKAAFADGIGEDRAVISALAANAEFYTADMRAEIPPQVSWRMCSRARRRSGWRPGAVIEHEHRTRALAFVLEFADRVHPTIVPGPVLGWDERLERVAGVLRRLLEMDGVPERYRRRLRAALDALGEG